MLRLRAKPPSTGYAALVAATAVLALAGYLGYVLYPRFDLPAGRGALLLALAAGTGVASFFSPCSFALLVTMLTRTPSNQAGVAVDRPARSALKFAAALSLGATTFLLCVGLAMALGADTFFEGVKFDSREGRIIRGATGELLIVLGLIQLGVLRRSLGRLEGLAHRLSAQAAPAGRERPTLRFVLFGFGYLLAGFG